MLIYCNDGKERIAHIRGSLRKKVAKLEVGDIVLISLRGESMGASAGSSMDRGDILAKYERDVYRQLKNIEGINPKLFNQLEVMDVNQRASNIVNPVDDCGFDMDGSDEEDEDCQEETVDENGNVMIELTKEERATKKIKEDTKRAMLRTAKEGSRNTNNDDDIDIDAI
jgi:initiation factor 1A